MSGQVSLPPLRFRNAAFFLLITLKYAQCEICASQPTYTTYFLPGDHRMRFALTIIFFGLVLPSLTAAQGTRLPIQCNGVVECAQAMVSMTNALAEENAQLKRRLTEIEQNMWKLRQGGPSEMGRGAVRVEGSRSGYRETTIVFKTPFRSPPMIFLSPRDVNLRDHQQLWVKAVNNERAVIASCRRHTNPEGCVAYADDFHFDWIAVRR